MPDDAAETIHPVDAGPQVAPDATAPATTPASEQVPVSVLTWVGLLLGGVVLGLFGTVLMASRVVVAGRTVPWGLVLSLLAVLTCVRGAAWLVGSRRGAAMVGLGWVLPTLAFATTNPGGDVLLPDITRTYVYLVGAVGLIVLGAALPLPRGARQEAAGSRARRAGSRTGRDAPDGTTTDTA